MTSVRNFSIIAHIDHGKSTLADRMLELTATVEPRKMKAQILDSMELERERGITIKMRPVRMRYACGGVSYTLNLIDTPGHIDFSYEVSRALSAVEGAILLVDATQGIEAQTLTVLRMAEDLGLAIIPALSKVDAPHARVAEMRAELAELLGIEESEILLTSGKTGAGVAELLEAIVTRIPAPALEREEPGFRGLIFDFAYSNHRGVIVYVRAVDGEVRKGDELRFHASQSGFTALEVGVFTPDEEPREVLRAGEIGYIVTGIKEPGVASVGDTISTRGDALPLPGYAAPRPVVWASLFPESQDDFVALRSALARLRLTDSSLSYEEESSSILGRGYRCGFLGMLHIEIVTERLRREFGLALIVTLPSIAYAATHKSGVQEMIYAPSKFPDAHEVLAVEEPWVRIRIITPPEHVGAILKLLHEHEAMVGDSELFRDGRTALAAEMPLRELMRGFFDRLKNATSGFASLSYELADLRPADVVRLDMLVAEEVVPAFTRIVSRRRAEEDGRAMVERLAGILPRQLFVTKIQASAFGRILASHTISALKKDVTGYLYGGDITRKKKLWEKQKKGKKRMQARAKVTIPQEVLLAMLRES